MPPPEGGSGTEDFDFAAVLDPVHRLTEANSLGVAVRLYFRSKTRWCRSDPKATEAGRRMLRSIDPAAKELVVAAIAFMPRLTYRGS